MKTKAAALALVGGLALSLVAGVPAVAATTTITSTTPPVEAIFGDPWMLELVISADSGGYATPVNESSGSVDVFIEQIPGVFLDNATVQANGRVFVTQPPAQPFLAPGTYDVRAVFTPASGTGLKTAQVRVPGAITITPLELVATIAVQADAAATPSVTIALAATGETALGTLPPGVWTVSVTEASATEVLFSRDVVQTTAFDPLVIELTDDLRPGVDHVLTAEFTPVAEFAAGVVVTGTGETPFRTASQDLGELISAPVDLPLWALIVALVGALAGIVGLVTAIVVRVRRSSRAREDESDDRAENSDGEPGDAPLNEAESSEPA